jgi:hypothetical protein
MVCANVRRAVLAVLTGLALFFTCRSFFDKDVGFLILAVVAWAALGAAIWLFVLMDFLDARVRAQYGRPRSQQPQQQQLRVQ